MTQRELTPADQRFAKVFNKKGNYGPIRETFADLIDGMDIAMWKLDMNYRVVPATRKPQGYTESMSLEISATGWRPNRMCATNARLKRFKSATKVADPNMSARIFQVTQSISTPLPRP